MRHSSTSTHRNKHEARPPVDHFKRFLEEVYPNHAYPIKHKLKDCSMMRSFMTSGSLTRCVELDKGPDGINTTPSPMGKSRPNGRQRTCPTREALHI
jgi:hypothetical protein